MPVGCITNRDSHAVELDFSWPFARCLLHANAGKRPIGGFDGALWLALNVEAEIIVRTEAAQE